MENFRSMSCREGRMQMENKGGGQPTSMQDLRSYSTSYATTYVQVHPQPSSTKDYSRTNTNNLSNYKKSKASSSTKGWSLSDPEIQRRKRVASYKVYAVEGKMKGSLRKSFRWVKHTCSHVVHGWW